MTHGSLFSGIGGFDLAAEWMGWENIFHCEKNEFGKRILQHYWPNAETIDDITTQDFRAFRGKIDILTGGFPCQPYSQAGKRLGKEDDRHLWPEMLRAIREIKPKYVVGENVYGLINWSDGLVFDEVQADLENEGYRVQPVVLPACAVNAPHRRDRVWFVAYSDLHGHQRREPGKDRQEKRESKGERNQRKRVRDDSRGNGKPRNVANASSCGLQGSRHKGVPREKEHGKPKGFSSARPTSNAERIGSPREEHRQKEARQHTEKGTGPGWENFPTESPICPRDDGFSSRLDRITFPKWRNESIKAAGNAIVPQVAHQIFKAIVDTQLTID